MTRLSLHRSLRQAENQLQLLEVPLEAASGNTEQWRKFLAETKLSEPECWRAFWLLEHTRSLNSCLRSLAQGDLVDAVFYAAGCIDSRNVGKSVRTTGGRSPCLSAEDKDGLRGIAEMLWKKRPRFSEVEICRRIRIAGKEAGVLDVSVSTIKRAIKGVKRPPRD